MKALIISLVVLVIGLTLTVAYLSLRQNISPSNSPPPNTIACTVEAKICPDGSSVSRTGPNCEFSACPEVKTKKVAGGGILSFPKYELSIPTSWTSTRESQGKDDEKITITNGSSAISILQGGFGGSICLFPGDPDSEGPSGRYIKYKDITTKSGDKLRRSTPENGKGFGICQQTKYGWGAPTLYGHISLTTPTSPTVTDLDTIDAILTSLTKL